MTITERINDSLERGLLNYKDIKDIVRLDEERQLYDCIGGESTVERTSIAISKILDKADLTPSERLQLANEKMKK